MSSNIVLDKNKSNRALISVKLISLLFSALLFNACAKSSLKFVNGLVKNSGYTLNANIPYAQHKLNTLDIYMPTKSTSKPKPVVIFFYGGCWGACLEYRKKYYLFVGQALASRGFTTVITDYQTYPKVRFNTIIRDAAKSVEWVKSNIAQYGGDPDSIFLMGHSAGAHLAATLSYDRRYLKKSTWNSVRGMIGLAGAYDFFPFNKKYQFKVFGPASSYPDSQPIRFVTGKEAPSLLLYGKKDLVVKARNIINLANKIRKKGGQVEVHLYTNLSHVGIIASLARPLQKSRPVLRHIQEFIMKNSP